MIGYWLLQAMQNALPGRQVAAMVNQTLVDADDPAFKDPTKFVGEVYSQQEAERLAAERGWSVKADGQYYRRVVGSPQPQGVVETDVIRTLVEHGTVVVCAGGGGVPVIRTEGRLQGVEAVIDKDLTASVLAVLAQALEADALFILTDVDGVYKDFGTEDQEQVPRATPASLRGMGLPAGSMGPKVEAVCRFVESTGKTAAIGRLEDAVSQADALFILTDVDGVYKDFGTEDQEQVPRATPASLRGMGLPAGSMGPKVEAVCRFVESTGKTAAIGRLEDAVSLVEGTSGTIVSPEGS